MSSAVGVVFAKEMVDNLRDRRSVLVALIYPLVGATLLGLLMAFVGGLTGRGGDAPVALAVAGGERAPDLLAFLRDNDIDVTAAPDDPAAAVRDGRIEIALIVDDGFAADLAAERPAGLSLLISTTRLSTVVSSGRVGGLLQRYAADLADSRLLRRGIDPASTRPLRIAHVNVSESRSLAGFFLNMLPPFVIFTIFVGGVYLAIDSTSGERERGSLEPLLVNPVARGDVMLGKALATLAFTAVTVLLQLVAFKIMFGLLSLGGFGVPIDPGLDVFAAIFVISLPLMLFAVALQIIVAAACRSYKETQTYLGLLPLIPALPGMILVFVPLKAQLWMMALPTFGQILLIGQLVRDEPVDPAQAAVSMVATTLAALVLLHLARRLYERDALLLGG